jgi:hypothetical protein
MERISPSSPGSEGSTSPSRPTASDASDRSSGTPPAPESSSDGGRLFDVGEMSPGSDSMLGTPSAADALGGHLSRGGDRSDELLLKGQVKALLPTPTVADENEWLGNPTRFRGTSRRSDGSRPTSDDNLAARMSRLTSSSVASPASQSPPPAGAREPRTIAGSGPSSPVLLASWDRATSSWKTFQGSLLSTEDERFPRSWERWPTSGMTRRGRAFALPTSARATADSGSSSLPLATPASHPRTHTPRRVDHGVQLANQIDSMLHTPTGSDTNPSYDHRASPGYTPRFEGFDAGNHRGQPDSVNQTVRQLKTPRATRGGSSTENQNELLPTPVSDHSRGLAQPGTDYQSLPNTILELPTPRAAMRKVQSREDYHSNLEELIGSLGDHTPPPSSDGNES